ncbi:MAG: HlyD family type I secretion periplasmic adaptor subunit [Proteobacteria bacterium]|nr:HlyD family type I secretion periplasmic adaptor subunit [Pseudomonadota bacterium]
MSTKEQNAMTPALSSAKKPELEAPKNKLFAISERFIKRFPESPKVQGAIACMDQFVQFLTRKEYNVENSAVAMTRGPIVVGMWLFLVVFGIFGIWSITAPIESAAVAPGSIVLDANKKTIQHLEGGIITEIMVRDGDMVKQGDPLIRLSETAARARQEILLSQYRTARVMEDRLESERDNLDRVVLKDDIIAEKDVPEMQQIITTQLQLFESRRNSLKGKISVLEQRIKQSQQEINGTEAQQKSAGEQVRLLDQEIATVKQLVDKGQGLRPRLLALQRSRADLQGQQGEYIALSARASQAIAESKLQIINAQNEYLNDVVNQLREVQNNVADLRERTKASSDILSRIVITAPHSGIISGLRFHTIGGVIPPGAEIMDIIPQDDKMVVEVQVDPRDIDVVHKGLKARVHLSAYKTRTVPNLDGVVEMVSADRIVDRATGRSFYTARVVVSEDEIKKLTTNVELYPGMPAEVLIVTGERTFMGYFLQPIEDSFRNAFREQ